MVLINISRVHAFTKKNTIIGIVLLSFWKMLWLSKIQRLVKDLIIHVFLAVPLLHSFVNSNRKTERHFYSKTNGFDLLVLFSLAVVAPVIYWYSSVSEIYWVYKNSKERKILLYLFQGPKMRLCGKVHVNICVYKNLGKIPDTCLWKKYNQKNKKIFEFWNALPFPLCFIYCC